MLPYTPSKILGKMDRILNLPLFICKRCSMILPILQILLFFSSRKYTIAKNSTFELHTWLSNYHEIQFGNWKTKHIVFWETLGPLTWKCKIKNPSNEYDLQGSKKQTGLFEKPNFRFDKIELYLYVYFWTTVLMTVCTTLLSELETSFHRKKTNTKKQTYCFDFFFHQKWMASLSYRKKALSKA